MRRARDCAISKTRWRRRGAVKAPRPASIGAGDMFGSRSVSSGVFALMLMVAPSALAQVPPYMQADPAAVTKAFGKPAADKIFSEAYTPARRQAVLQSVKSIPGYDCPADPPITLALV